MNIEKIEQLLDKYFEGRTSRSEERELRRFFSSEEVPEHLESYRDQFMDPGHFKEALTGEFDALARIDITERGPEGGSEGSLYGEFRNRRLLQWTLRIAAGLILLLVGFSAGLMVQQSSPSSDKELAALKREVNEIKSALVYGTTQQASASERLSAVQLSTRLQAEREGLDEVTDILVYTMNNDESVNVRIAAAEALYRFHEEPRIRHVLVKALTRQEDPLMQITLIDMLVEIKAKSALDEMQKLLMNDNTQEIVKTRLQEGIAELRT